MFEYLYFVDNENPSQIKKFHLKKYEELLETNFNNYLVKFE